MSDDDDAHRAAALVEQIKPILAGEAPEVQSAVLADLLAMWLAGNVVLGDAAETTRLRADLFDDFVRLVGNLIRLNEQKMGIDQLMDVQGGRQ